MLSSLILALFPRYVLIRYLGWLDRQAEALYEENHRIERLLDKTEGEQEYLFGYKNHLRRKLIEFDEEMDGLIEKINFLENFLYPSSE